MGCRATILAMPVLAMLLLAMEGRVVELGVQMQLLVLEGWEKVEGILGRVGQGCGVCMGCSGVRWLCLRRCWQVRGVMCK